MAKRRIVRRWHINMDVLDDTHYVDRLTVVANSSSRHATRVTKGC